MLKNFLITPFQRFVKTESLAGALLFGATLLALIWANSAFGAYYEELWRYKLGFWFESFELKKPLILWINDGLMAIFFFLIGLELKRELLVGEINTFKKAAFPFIAAFGGIVIPVGIYLWLNQNPQTVKGWGIPMSTDIAFALAILSTLGNRVPLSLKIFLTAFAIIDDIAAVLVIAVFYSDHINWLYIVYGLGLIGLLGGYYHVRKYTMPVGLIISVVVWYLFLKSGIHPTIAGVLLAFTIPIKNRIHIRSYADELAMITDNIIQSHRHAGENHLLTKDEMNYIDNLDDLNSEVRSPLQHLEHKLHGLIAYFILPLFAFANAGVIIDTGKPFDISLMTHIIAGLFIGKFIGVSLFSYLGVKLGLAELPAGVGFKQILGIAAIAGVGFTMSIFIGNLAFSGDTLSINSAKLGIIIGSILSGMTGYIILKFTRGNSRV